MDQNPVLIKVLSLLERIMNSNMENSGDVRHCCRGPQPKRSPLLRALLLFSTNPFPKSCPRVSVLLNIRVLDVMNISHERIHILVALLFIEISNQCLISLTAFVPGNANFRFLDRINEFSSAEQDRVISSRAFVDHSKPVVSNLVECILFRPRSQAAISNSGLNKPFKGVG